MAAGVVIRAIQRHLPLVERLESAGFMFGSEELIPSLGFYFKGDGFILTHSSANTEAFTNMVRVFLAVNRTPEGRKFLQEKGIRPLIAGS